MCLYYIVVCLKDESELKFTQFKNYINLNQKYVFYNNFLQTNFAAPELNFKYLVKTKFDLMISF